MCDKPRGNIMLCRFSWVGMDKLTNTRRWIAAVLLAATALGRAGAVEPRSPARSLPRLVQSPAQSPALSPAGSPAASPATRELKVTFAEMGAESIALHGVQSSAGVNLGVRRDEVVVGAVMHLRLAYSPSLLQDLSHLRITLNGQTTAALPLTKSDGGHEITRTVDLDPRYFTDYNQIRLDLIGHYSLECEDPEHSSIWATIGGASDITLTLRPIELRDDL